MLRRFFLILLIFLILGGCTSTTMRLQLPELKTVSKVDLERYLGTWYEIASYPQYFQNGCTASTANYSLKANGEINVINTCYLDRLDGPKRVAKGRARVVDKESNAKLQVSFFLSFWGDYWIIDLDKDYEYAVVGHPSRDYLWILCRHPFMEETVYKGILTRLNDQGYDLDRLKLTLQKIQ